MIALGLILALTIGAPQQGSSVESQTTVPQRAHDEYERHRQAAIRINELAGRIQSEADASALVSEIAGLFAKELPRPGPAAVSVSELPTLNTRRLATRQPLSPSSGLSMSGTNT
jgi:hypothetical protein